MLHDVPAAVLLVDLDNRDVVPARQTPHGCSSASRSTCPLRLRRTAPPDAEGICDAVTTALSTASRADDVALLVVKVL